MAVVDSQESELNGRYRWIPWIFVGFFLVVFTVNGIFVYLATTSWVGLVTENPYDRGLNYNEVLAAKAAQDQLGWNHSLAFERTGLSGNTVTGVLTLSLTGHDGTGLDGATVKAVVERPGRYSQAFVLYLDQTGDGQYAAGFELPLPGQWHVRLAAKKGADSYRSAETFYVEPN